MNHRTENADISSKYMKDVLIGKAVQKRSVCRLRLLVVASMLTLSDISSFAAREAKVFSDDPEIVAMSDLRQSLEANDLARFERTVNNKKNRIYDEPFIMKYLSH